MATESSFTDDKHASPILIHVSSRIYTKKAHLTPDHFLNKRALLVEGTWCGRIIGGGLNKKNAEDENEKNFFFVDKNEENNILKNSNKIKLIL